MMVAVVTQLKCINLITTLGCLNYYRNKISFTTTDYADWLLGDGGENLEPLLRKGD